MTLKTLHLTPALLLSLATFLAACGTAPTVLPSIPPTSNNTPEIQYIVITATPQPLTSTPDPCASENIEAEVQKIHAYMREFDDAASLAGNIMQSVARGQMQMSDLSDTIPNLQLIRRDAEKQPTPSCLIKLKTYQINHMNTVLNSLNAFIAGDQQGFDQNRQIARQYHDAYTLELASLLGLTVEPASTIPSQTPSP